MTTRWRRKNNRLSAENYVGSNAYMITATTDGRRPSFKDAAVVTICVEKLTLAAESESMDILAYVFMPDHLHLLLTGDEQSNLATFMKRFKQTTAFEFKREHGLPLWQKGFHDHVLRHEEDLNDVARYLAENPLRAGLVDDWKDYQHTGGWVLDEVLNGDLKVAATSTTPAKTAAMSASPESGGDHEL